MTTKYEWAKIELLGHRVRYGRCSVVDFMDGKLLRVEVPFADRQVVKSADGSEEEQFATVEEYPFSALYCRTPMTEEDVRKAVQPWRPETSSSSTQSNDDLWDGEDDSEPSSDMGKAMREVLQPEDGKMWAYEFPDRDGDILEIRRSPDPDTAAVINADRDWCADAEQLGALHECIGKILAERDNNPATNVTQRAPHFVDIDEHSYVAAHIDLDECVRCHGGVKTHPLVSIDGSAVLGEHCLACKATWWHAFPVMPTPAMVRPPVDVQVQPLMITYTMDWLTAQTTRTLYVLYSREFGVHEDCTDLNRADAIIALAKLYDPNTDSNRAATVVERMDAKRKERRSASEPAAF